MSSAPTILVVEDEPPMQSFLQSLVRSHALKALLAASVEEAVALAAMHTPDVVLLDLGLPDGDGLDVVRRLRAWSTTPILVISARGRERDKVDALDAGADDYLTKPFSAQELMARIRVALRHRAQRGGDEGPVFAVDGLSVDLARRLVRRDGAEVALTPTEYKILEHLVLHAGRVVTHAQILRAVWGPHATTRAHYVRVHVHALRGKIERDPTQPRILVTESGIGYRLLDELPP
ncbi:MAG: response regulator [bacterium]|nr:response regulator [Myxococcales bacterium]MCB9552288.1 response regulator [Myxococcales bacterium]